jgi:hypothetical protein
VSPESVHSWEVVGEGIGVVGEGGDVSGKTGAVGDVGNVGGETGAVGDVGTVGGEIGAVGDVGTVGGEIGAVGDVGAVGGETEVGSTGATETGAAVIPPVVGGLEIGAGVTATGPMVPAVQ